MVTVIVDPSYGLAKERLIAEMGRRKIDCRPLFYPLSSLPAYEPLPQAAEARRRNAVSYRLSPYGMNLPSSLSLTAENVHTVCQALKEILAAR